MRVKYVIMILKQNYLERLEPSQILDLSEFIVKENFKHHSNNILPAGYKTEIDSIYNKEVMFFNNTEIFVAKNYLGVIVGSIRVLKWNYIDILPIQKIFGINPLMVSKNSTTNNVYHIGRFAIKREVGDINLFKQLIICAITPICSHKGNIAFAECDSKLLRILSLLGIKTTVIGESVNYLGSETIPIYLDYYGLIGFYNKNKTLVSKEVLNQTDTSRSLQESVVLFT